MRRLSVVMTGKNRTTLLERSLFATCSWQQFDPEQAELVYVDDCSEDFNVLVDLLDRWSKYFYQIKLIRMDKKLSRIPVAWNCPALGINIAVKAAENEIILKTDPECLPITETVIEALRLFDEKDVWFFSTRMLTEEESAEFAIDQMEESHPAAIHDQKLKHLPGRGLWSVSPHGARYAYWFGTVFSKSRFMHIGGVDEEFLRGFAGDDDDWANRMKMSGAEWKWSDQFQILHQFHGTANAAFHLSPQHKHNIALVQKAVLEKKVVANEGEDWGSDSAVTDMILLKSRAESLI